MLADMWTTLLSDWSCITALMGYRHTILLQTVKYITCQMAQF